MHGRGADDSLDETRRWGLSAGEIENHPRLRESVRRQAGALLAMRADNPRMSSVFATQQRWLLAHLTLATYFESLDAGAEGMRAAAVMSVAVGHGVASRNTADAFLQEMIKYGYIETTPSPRDRRARDLRVAKLAIAALGGWLRVHLATLDALDGAERGAAFDARPELLARAQPRIARGIMKSSFIREPTPTFSLFTWLNEGGVVMDWLYAGLDDAAPDSPRFASSVRSTADFQDHLLLSRSHLTRKLRAAEIMGSLGWMGERGKSTMWLSAGFVREYLAQQAAKLAVVDAAFQWAIEDA
jgi:hypothetical protein